MDVEPVELFAPMRSSVIRFRLVEIGPDYYPAFQLGIEIEDDGFIGRGAYWVTIPEWETFMSELVECERTRRGSATLGELGNWDSFFNLESANSQGHFAVTYRLTHMETSLNGSFALDSEFFGQMVSGFQRLDEAVSNKDR